MRVGEGAGGGGGGGGEWEPEQVRGTMWDDDANEIVLRLSKVCFRRP